jgi:hypothetical protein
MGKGTGLPDEATRERRATLHPRARGDDEVGTDDAIAQRDGCLSDAIDTTVVEATCPDDLCIVADLDVGDIPNVRDMGMGADRPVRGSKAVDIAHDELTEALDELGSVPVHRHEVGFVCRELIIAEHLTPTGLIEDRDLYPIAEGSLPLDEDGIDVADEGLLADGVIGDIVIDMLDTAVVPHLYIVQVGIVEARMLGDAPREVEGLLEEPQTHPA